MKQYFLFILLAGCYVPVCAQTQKGQSITSGSLSLTYRSSVSRSGAGATELGANIRTFGAEYVLNRGHFFRDNWSFNYSLNVGYSGNWSDNASSRSSASYESTANTYRLGVGLAVRRYWLLAERLHAYAGGGIQVYTNRGVYREASQFAGSEYNSYKEEKTGQVQPVGQAGLLYTLTNRLALEANAQTNGFPIEVGTVGIGLALLTGNTGGGITPSADELDAAPQTQKGRWLVGASATVSSTNLRQQQNAQTTTEASTLNATASLLVGRFIRNNVLLGVGASYTGYRSRSGSQTADSDLTYDLTADVYLRSYLGNRRLRPFVQGGVSYSFTKYPGSDYRPVRLGLNAAAGLAYLVGDRFLIQTTLGSLNSSYGWSIGVPEDATVRSFAVGATATLTPGFAVYYAL